MRKEIIIFIVFGFLLIIFVPMNTYAIDEGEEVELRGIAVEKTPNASDSFLDHIYDRFDSEEYSLYRFYPEDGGVYNVITTGEIETGPILLKGTLLADYGEDSELRGVIREQSHSPMGINQEVTFDKFAENKSKFSGHGIIITGGFAGISVTYDHQSYKIPFTRGALMSNPQSFSYETNTFIRKARKISLEASNNTDPQSNVPVTSAQSGIFESGWVYQFLVSRDEYTSSIYHERFWFSGKAKVSVAVVPDSRSGDEVGLFTISSSPVETKSQTSFEDVADNPEKYVGEVVRIESNSIINKISMKEAILSVNKCGSESVMTSHGCIPLILDVTVHAGVAYSRTEGDVSALPIAGISNFDQDTLQTTETGEFVYTGRVVSMEQISPRLSEGYALVIYEQEKLGNTREGDLPSEYITGEAERFSSYMRDQVALSEEEWTAVKDDNEETLLNRYQSTPTAAPQESENTNAQSTPSSTTSGEAATPTSTFVSTQPATGDEQNGTLINDIFPTLLIAAFVLILVAFVLSVANALVSSLIWFIRYIEKKAFGEPRYGKEAFGDFRISFSCDNCGNGWRRSFHQGDKIHETDSGVTVSIDEGTEGNLFCPVCDTHHAVTIEDKNPTE